MATLLVASAWLFVGACGQTTAGNPLGDDDFEEGDQDPPAIVVDQIADGQPSYQDVTVTATVTDDTEVTEVTLFHHNLSSADFVAEAMVLGSGDVYSGTIPADSVSGSRVYYYVEACDGARPANCATSPTDVQGSDDAFAFNVQ